jgi:hypothetical protein
VTAATLHDALGTEPATQLAGRHHVTTHDAMLGWVAQCSCGWSAGGLRDAAAAEVERRLHVHATRPLPVPSSSSETKPGCVWCGCVVHRARTGRPPRFCSTSCRQASYRSTSLPPAVPPTIGTCGLLARDCYPRHAPTLGHLS